MAQIARDDAQALIPEDSAREIIQSIPEESVIMRLGRRLPNMARNQRRLPILSALVQATFVDGEPTTETPTGGRKSVTRAAWTNKFINAGEIAAIVPIPENVLDDADFDIWGEVRPRIAEAIGAKFDAAVLYGTNAPSDWPNGIVPDAVTAGHVVTQGADLYADLFEPDGVLAKVEEDGYMVTGHIGALQLRAALRGMRDLDQRPIFFPIPQERNRYLLDGIEAEFPLNGAVDPAESLLISGDFARQLVWAMRSDITYKVLDQATLQDEDGAILYNLAQQDMVALRAVVRLGWQLPNPINRVNEDDDTRFPFAVLAPSGS